MRKFPEAWPCHGRHEFSQFLTRYLDVYSEAEWAIQELEDHVTLRGALHALGLQGETLEAAGLREKSAPLEPGEDAAQI